MTPETKSEIIVVGIAGAVLLFIWARNRNAGAGTGLENLPSFSNQQTPLGGAPLFNIPAPVPGLDVSYTGSPWSLAAPNSFAMDGGGASACNCSSGSQSASTFGAPSDLAAWLSSQPDLVQSAADAVTNWN
jgi:hypothetical protein